MRVPGKYDLISQPPPRYAPVLTRNLIFKSYEPPLATGQPNMGLLDPVPTNRSPLPGRPGVGTFTRLNSRANRDEPIVMSLAGLLLSTKALGETLGAEVNSYRYFQLANYYN